ncbi:ThiF family adenylyltransferase [candidate division CSSED10-310 bacterium]|uniref:ThiF family adenylyltransferase n=1 Tax=candidate division CSSED10-310 bacterium TaxID=2855610 RepID=A0ABV6YSU2_UNCC1
MIKIDGDSSPDSEDRFTRFDLISWWDQKRLKNAHVLIAGAGALGNEIIKNCALVGIGNIFIADMDRIENSNLSRSVLFRKSDNGKLKAEIACQAAKDIYPEIMVQPFHGNIVHDLGLGVYFWADVIIGGLDNREARIALNTGSFFARKPWIDGAIEVLDGVARVFMPGAGPCYECTMSELDWKIIQDRRSCSLLSRTEMEQGKVPTTPTTASVIAGIQMQEAIKIIHNLDTLAGQGYIYSGLSGESYLVQYPRKPDCFGHETFSQLQVLNPGVQGCTVGELLERARTLLGSDAVIGLSRDILAALHCPHCLDREEIFCSLGSITEDRAPCPGCGTIRIPETLITLGLDHNLCDRTFAEIGVPYFDVVTARTEKESISFLFGGDSAHILGSLPDKLVNQSRSRES